jgi:hypothetical protein
MLNQIRSSLDSTARECGLDQPFQIERVDDTFQKIEFQNPFALGENVTSRVDGEIVTFTISNAHQSSVSPSLLDQDGQLLLKVDFTNCARWIDVLSRKYHITPPLQ